jgi:hypothetical protein
MAAALDGFEAPGPAAGACGNAATCATGAAAEVAAAPVLVITGTGPGVVVRFDPWGAGLGRAGGDVADIGGGGFVLVLVRATTGSGVVVRFDS